MATTPLVVSQAITAATNSGQALAAPNLSRAAALVSAGTPVVSAGIGSRSDDSAAQTTDTTSTVNAAGQDQLRIVPRPNILDEYASYTYSASVYLLTQSQYEQLLNTSAKQVDGYQLLFQSGGAPSNIGGIRTPTPTDQSITSAPNGGRSPFFDHDFYIDSISIENLPAGKPTGAAHNVSSMRFTVVEPLGITLIERLYDAVANSKPVDASGKVNYLAAQYLMVIRFYGYDTEGNLQQIKTKIDPEGTSDSAAVVEKFIPFKIESINWSVGTKLTSYEWRCVPTGLMIGSYTSRGTVPYDIELTNTTVGGLLAGKSYYGDAGDQTAAETARLSRSGTPTQVENQTAAETARLARSGTPATTTSAPPKAVAAPQTTKKTITGGLMAAMNDIQQQLVNQGTFTYADEYEIEFVGVDAKIIQQAELQLPNQKIDKKMTGTSAPPTQNVQALDMNKISMDPVSRKFSVTAGQQLVQVIELAIRNSSYIRDQALVIVNPDGTSQPNPNSRNQPLKWFVITMSAQPKQFDPKRNDHAYKIKYTVASRVVKNVISKYFPPSKFTGVHKTYPFWFTGKNTAVLEYQESLNALYNLTVSGSKTEKSFAERIREKFTSSMADLVMYNYAPTSTESKTGSTGKENEPGANAAENLYSQGDLRECKIKILGDPAWIMQGSLFRAPSNDLFSGPSLTTGFNADGSISFDNQDILFEINFQKPRDFDLDTGVANPYSKTQEQYNNRSVAVSRVYLCKKVISEFKQGTFEQTLEGALYLYPVPNKTNAANPAAVNGYNEQGQAVGLEVRDALGTVSTTTKLNPETGDLYNIDSRVATGEVNKAVSRLGTGSAESAGVLGVQNFAKPFTQFAITGAATLGGTPQLGTQTIVAGAQLLQNASVPGLATAGLGDDLFAVPGLSLPSAPKLPGQTAGAFLTPAQLSAITSRTQSVLASGTTVQSDSAVVANTTTPTEQKIVKEA